MNLEVRPDMSVSNEDIENFKKLTDLERQVLRWVSAGKTSDEISTILGISPSTVKNHRAHIEEKLNKHNSMAECVTLWIRLGHTEDENFENGAGI